MSTEAPPRTATATGSGTTPTAPAFDADRRWRVHDRVAVRPEEFGALLYHYGTRRLTFLKDPRLLDVVRALEVQPSVPAACRAAGLTDEQVPSFVAAVARLAAIDMLVPAAERTPTPSPRSPG